MCKVKDGESSPLGGYLARRAGFGNEPAEGRFRGIDIIGEYWLQTTDPRVIAIFEADENGPVLELVSEWETHFDVTVVPAVDMADIMSD